MDDLEKIKHNLASSAEWKQIKQIELDKIVYLSSGVSDPLMLKGMLRTIYDIDNWIKRENKE